MVDLNTAMAAASVDRQKRAADEGKERMKRRSGRDLGIEAFDPVKHVAKEKAETEAKNTAVAKFKANVEARFYTALAKQITDNVFGTDGLQQDSGTFTSPIGGEVVQWTTPSGTGNVVVTVTETDGSVTTFTMPKEDNS